MPKHDMHFLYFFSAIAFVDLYRPYFLVAVLVVALVYYLIPDTIFSTAQKVKATVNCAVSALCEHAQEPERLCNSFSAPEYLFVSTKVAKAFPEMVESAIILAYRTPILSLDRQMIQRTKEGNKSQVWLQHSWMKSLKFILINAALFLGSQSLPTQETVASLIASVFTGAAVYLGSAIYRDPTFTLSLLLGWPWNLLNGRYFVANGLQSRCR